MLGIHDKDGMKAEEWDDDMDVEVGSVDDEHVRVHDLGHDNGYRRAWVRGGFHDCCHRDVNCYCRRG